MKNSLILFTFCFVLTLSLCNPANAQDGDDSIWILSLAGRNFLVIDLEAQTLSRPKHFNGYPGRFEKISAETKDVHIEIAETKSGLLLTERDGAQWLLDNKNGAIHLMVDGERFASSSIHSSRGKAKVSHDWPQGSLALPAPLWADNDEMTKMFEEDQKPRLSAKTDWKTLEKEDESRRKRVREMLEEGELKSARDYYHAAFIFQHGSDSEDYLLAHTLATISLAKGDRSAAWIAAATLDRFLNSIGQKQIYGTQYYNRDGWTQDPMEPSLVTDGLRTELQVPIRAKQIERLEEYKTQESPSSKEKQSYSE